MVDEPLHERLADALVAAGSTAMFGLPGGGPNLDVVGAAMARGIRFVLAHGEAEAAIMASTYGLLTRTPSTVIATRGPGATSLTNGVAQATLDRYPLVAITDTVPSDQVSWVAHQRLDQRALLSPVSKASVTLGRSADDEQLRSLILTAGQWPYGAIHLDYDPTSVAPLPTRSVNEPASPSNENVERAVELLRAAERPLIIAGAEAASRAGALAPLIGRAGVRVLTTYQAVGLVPTEGTLNAGLFTNGRLESPVLADADLIITIGLDLVEPIPRRWQLDCPVVRVSAVVQTDDYLPATVDLVGDVATSFEALVHAAERAPASAVDCAVWREAARREIRSADAAPDLGPTTLVDVVAQACPRNATVTVDAGAHFLTVMPLWPVDRPYRLLISNGLATMGFAIPAAIGAALARPDQPVVTFTGDAGLSMVMAELETITRLRLPITIVVFNDASLSLIKVKQTTDHGGADVVDYAAVDFARIADASGLRGVTVTSRMTLEAELANHTWDTPRLIDARIDPSAYPEILRATRG